MMTAPEVATTLIGTLLEGVDVLGELPDVAVTGVSMNSREVVPGDLFLACAGFNSHGLEYIANAIDHGASVVVAEVTSDWLPEKINALAQKCNVPVIAATNLNAMASKIAGRFYCQPSEQMSVIGITGTNGKTSCSHFIAHAFSRINSGADGKHKRVAVLGTVGNGFPGELMESTHTTADPVAVQAMLAQFKAQQADMVAMEVSSHALQQHRVADVKFDVAVLTNFSRDHLDYHGTMADYASAKSLLFKMAGLKTALINVDDELGQRLLDELQTTRVRTIGYGIGLELQKYDALDAYMSAENIVPTPQGLRFDIASSWGVAEINLPLLGRFNVLNAVVTLGVLLECGQSFEAAVASIEQLQTVSGRMEILHQHGLPTVVVDYAHTPDALEKALMSLREHAEGQLYCVFGCGGDRDKGKRPQMGAIAERCADKIFLTDDNPRHEDPELIRQDVLRGMKGPDEVVVEPVRATAIQKSIEMASAGDVILIAGKGHESYQLLGDLKVPFSDQLVAKAALEVQ